MENEIMNTMEEVVEEAVPTTQAIVEETVVPAAQKAVQVITPTAMVNPMPATDKNSKLVTRLILGGIAAAVAAAYIVRNKVKASKEKKSQEEQARIDEAVYRRWNAWIAAMNGQANNAGAENPTTEESHDESKESNEK